jgi:hypothetical protein
MSHYRNVVIKTFKATGGGSSKSVRASPIDGQGLDTSMKVECSSSMRKHNPVGSLFLLQAKVINKEGTDFLYAHYDTPYKVITEQDANEFLSKK